MANQTISGFQNIHGTNPQFLIDKMVRNKIYNSRYWKEFCTGLTAESLVDEAIQLEYVGGTYGGFRAPTKFLILALKMLQIQPDRDIVLEYIKNPDYKYITALAMFYWRLVSNAKDNFLVLEEYLQDFRKIRYRNEDGTFKLIHIDEFVDSLLTEEVVCSIKLPHIQNRINLEDMGQLEQRVSTLEKELNFEMELEQQGKDENQVSDNQIEESDKEQNDQSKKENKKYHNDYSKSYSRSRSRSREHKKKHKKKHHKKEKKHKKDKGNDWRKVVKGTKRNRDDDSKYDDKYNYDNNTQQKQVAAPKGSIEAENQLRASLGMPLLPTD